MSCLTSKYVDVPAVPKGRTHKLTWTMKEKQGGIRSYADINETVLETGLALRYMWVLVFMLPFQGVSLVLLYLLQSSARSAMSGSRGGGGSS